MGKEKTGHPPMNQCRMLKWIICDEATGGMEASPKVNSARQAVDSPAGPGDERHVAVERLRYPCPDLPRIAPVRRSHHLSEGHRQLSDGRHQRLRPADAARLADDGAAPDALPRGPDQRVDVEPRDAAEPLADRPTHGAAPAQRVERQVGAD